MTQHLTKSFIWVMCFAIFILVLPSVANAHEGLHEQIVAITAKIRLDPRNPSLYLKRGELHRLHRDWSRAAADYNRAAHLDPQLHVVDLARGKMLLDSRRLSEAKFFLDRFLVQQPNHFDGLLTRAKVLAGLGARVAAADEFTKAIKFAPSSEPELYLERARALAGDERHLQDALSGLDEGIKIFGPLATLELAAIELELRRKNYDAALIRLDLIAAQATRKEMWLVRRGEILKEAGRIEEARAAFDAALLAIESLPAERRQNRVITSLELRARSGLKF